MQNIRLKSAPRFFIVALIATVSACVGFMIHDLMTKQGMFMFYAEFFPPESFLHQEFDFHPETLSIISIHDEIQYDGCPDFEKNRATGCYPRLPPPTPKPCRMCSSQIHLAPGADASTSITVSFALDYDCGKNHSGVAVYLGKDRNNLIKIYTDSDTKQYTSTSCMAENPDDCYKVTDGHFYHWCTPVHFGTYQSDWFHHLIIPDLEPNTKYYYRVEPKPCNKKHEVFSFKTSPSSFLDDTKKVKRERKIQTSNNNYGVKIAITGDPGQKYDSDLTFRGIYSMVKDIDFFIITGDLSYANRDHRLHDRWFNRYQYLLASIPLMVTPGNHDIETDCCDWSIFKSFENRFRMPQIQPAVLGHACAERDSAPPNYRYQGVYDYGNSFYAVTIGPSKFIFLNTYSDSSKGSLQYNWLLNELSHVDRSATPWLFVVAHGTFYETFRKHKDETPQRTMRRAMEPLFKKYRVNAFFCGHDHLYARTHTVYDGKVIRDGHAPMYVTVGNGGIGRQHDSLPHEEPWLAAWDWWSYGFGVLTLVNSTHAHWETKFHNSSKTEFVPGTDSVYLVNYAQ